MSESCANPLLLEWIKEWLDEARERNSKGFTVYKKAYESMKACPLVFHHPSEAQQLNGLGPKLCDRLTAKLKTYCEENGLPMPEPPHKAAAAKSSKRAFDETIPDAEPSKKQRKPKRYVPALRSGPYALILGLATLNENSAQNLTKQQLIDVAQPFCDSSFTVPSEPGKFYTAWSSMKTLVQKDLVYEHGRPVRRYALTEEGWEVAKSIKKTLPGQSRILFPSSKELLAKPISESVGQRSNASAAPAFPSKQIFSPVHSDHDRGPFLYGMKSYENGSQHTPRRAPERALEMVSLDDEKEDLPTLPVPQGQYNFNDLSDPSASIVCLPPRSFTVQLILDNREVRASKDRDYISNELIKKGITPEVRTLELGDAMWVAKCHDPTFLPRHGEEGDEVVLDWIIERKRLDDLVASIKDGRFYEQKFRLRRSGIKNVIYLVEEFQVTHVEAAGSANALKQHQMIASAIASTQVINGYFVKQTRNLDDTIRYLTRMTLLLRKMYETPSSTLSASLQFPSLSSVRVIRTDHVSSHLSYLPLLEQLREESPSATFGVTFSTFMALSSKSDALSLRDVFLKMLMCTRGLTGEKALEIQRRWRTPRELVEAFETLDGSDPKEKENMIAERLKTLVGRRKISKALSKKIADVWGVDGFG